MNQSHVTKLLPDYLAKDLLKKSSRSFYLTLALVPLSIRDTLALAYLIARITDTLVDKINIANTHKIALLLLILNNITDKHHESNIDELKQQLASVPTTGIDHELLQALPDCLNYFHQLRTADKILTKQVLTTLFSAFHQDLSSFANNEQLQCLQSIKELQSYLYNIAGCVGEFWADLTYIHWPQYSTLPLTEAKSLAIEYGKALQLVNILRDIPADLQNNRCYLPAQQLQSFNISVDAITNAPEQLFPLVEYWIPQTRRYLQSAKRYTRSITTFSQRYALCLPILIAEKTLDKFHDGNYLKHKMTMKATHIEMKIIMIKAVIYAIFPMLIIK